MTLIDHDATTSTIGQGSDLQGSGLQGSALDGASSGVDRITVQLLDIIRKHTKTAGEDWNAATTLEDVGIDSFDLVELIFEIEDKYDISINFNANRTVDDFSTVGDVARVIEEGLTKEGRAA